MWARALSCVCGLAFLAGCADTSAIKNFAQTAPPKADLQAAATAYDQTLTNASKYDVLHTLHPEVIDSLKTQRDAQAKLIVINALAISQYMNELGAVAGLDTDVSADANNHLKDGLSALQKAGKVTAPEVAAVQALADFVGHMIESGVQNHALQKVITDENTDFQQSVRSELLVLSDLESTLGTERVQLLRLHRLNQALQAKTDSCLHGADAGNPPITDPFFRQGCASAYAALLSYDSWQAAQEAQLTASDAVAKKLVEAFTNIGAAHQKLYDRRNDLLTKATWTAIKSNVEDARTALTAVKKPRP